MRKKWLIIILTVALFLGMTVLGVSATFRIDAVTLNSSEISEPDAKSFTSPGCRYHTGTPMKLRWNSGMTGNR